MKITFSNKFILALVIVFSMYIIHYLCYENYDLGNGYQIGYDPSFDDLALQHGEAYVFGGTVLKFSRNEQYIVVLRKPREKIDSLYNLDSIRRNFSYEVYDAAYKSINYFEYWIIDKRNDTNYGPYKKSEYLLKMKELKIPEDLRVDK